MNMFKNQAGFSALEALLGLVIVAIVGATGFYVYHAKQNTNNYSSLSSSGAPALKNNSNKTGTTKTVSTATVPPKVVTIKSASGFSFSYPSDWAITAYGGNESVNGGIEPIPDGNAVKYLISKSALDSHNIVNDVCVDLTIGGSPVSYASLPGSVSRLNGGIQLWQLNNSSANSGYGPINILETRGKDFVSLTGGKTLNAYASFACSQGMSTTYTYQQQLQDSDFQSAVNVLKSITLN